MSKSRRPVRSRKAAKPRKASARKAAPRRASAPGRKGVTLKPLYQQLERTIGQLQKLPPSDRVKLAIERLSNCRMDIEQTCGPTMDVPADPGTPA